MKESFLECISLYDTRIKQRKQEAAALEALKSHIRPETYQRIGKDIKKAIRQQEKARAAVLDMIKDHPHELEREVIYKKWVEGYKLADLEPMFNYSLDYIQQLHSRGKRAFDNAHPIQEGAEGGRIHRLLQ